MDLKNRSVRVPAILTLLALLLGSFIKPALAQTSLDLVVHYVTGTPIKGQFAYDVSVYFSLLDSNGYPVKDVTAQDFSLSEDGQQVQIASLETAEDDPINVALVLDTSGSMSGQGIIDARKAAADFVSSLTADDKVAVVSFNSIIKTEIDFTTDQAAANQAITMITAEPGSGTCLFDAAYQAVQMTAALPPGRRAVILLTDGNDLKSTGVPCSTYTLEDVINLASQGTSRVPVYTIGLGNDVNTQDLGRLAKLTGGRYQQSSDSSMLNALFLGLSDQLRSQFDLHYTSSAAPGAHKLVLQANYLNSQVSSSRDFILPAFPLSLSITTPTPGQEVTGKVNILVNLAGQGEPIKQMVFKINGESIGTVSTIPYQLEWDTSQTEVGNVTIEVIAQDEDGAELASSSMEVTIPVRVAPTITPKPSSILSDNPLLIGGIIVLVLFVSGVGMILIVVATLRKRKLEKERDKRWEDTVVNPPEPTLGLSDRTLDEFAPGPGALGLLVVQMSDDPALVGQRFEITQSVTTLGRKATNDIPFPKDSPVSRQHAVIEERSGQLYMSEVLGTDEKGQAKRPSFGTFLNDQQIDASVLLREGDMIRLGNRLTLRFVAVAPSAGDSELTMDQSSDSEKTMDFGSHKD